MSAELFAALVAQDSRANPYPLYERFRGLGVFRLPGKPVYFASSFADCSRVLVDPAASAGRNAGTSGGGRAAILAAAGDDMPRAMASPPITMLDPPEHTRQRRLVSAAFTPRAVAGLTTAIRGAVDDLIDDLAVKAAAGDAVDVVAGFSLPLPFSVICALLGFPARDIDQLSAWSAALIRSIDPVLAIAGNRQDAAAAAAGIVQLHRYVEGVVAQRAAEPGPDLITSLLAAEDDGRAADRDEVVRFCVVLLVSGYETLVNLIANGLLALLRAPEQFRRLQVEPARIDAVVGEVLRFDPPVQMIVRTAREAMTVGGTPVPAGSTVVSLTAAANRDPAQYADPQLFDPDRGEHDDLAFGLGPHFCLGSGLARLEAASAIGRFAQRVAAVHPGTEAVAYRRGITIRGPRELPLRLGPVAPRGLPWPDEHAVG